MWNGTACIEVTVGWRDRHGYGHQWWRGRRWRSHRLAWTEAHGPIPAGMHVLHHCDNPPCIRHEHLFLGTQRDNIADMLAKGRSAIGDRNGSRTHPERLQRGDCNWTRRRPADVPRGEARGHALLSASDVPHIRDCMSSGLSQQSVADLFGVSRGTIRDLISGRTWNHVA